MYTFEDFMNLCDLDFSYTITYKLKNSFIVEFFNNPIIKLDYNYDAFELNIIGLYYEYIEKDYYLMKKYYLMSIEKNNHDSMMFLGLYYMLTDKDYKQMKKYYMMAIDKGTNKITF